MGKIIINENKRAFVADFNRRQCKVAERGISVKTGVM
jgi:hypothetical protein